MILRAAILGVLLASLPAFAQVTGTCGPGRICTSARFLSTGNHVRGTNTGATFSILSDVPDGVTSGTVAAITLRATQNIGDSDLVLNIENSVLTNLLTLNESGAGSIIGDWNVGADINLTATGEGTITSAATDATMGVATSGMRFYLQNEPSANDLAFRWTGLNLGNIMKIDKEGDLTILGALDLGSALVLAEGGTSKALTAVNGGIIYSDADSMEVSAAGSATTQVLASGGAGAPTWRVNSASAAAVCFGACAESTDFTGGVALSATGASARALTCSWNTAGSGGTTNVTLDIVRADTAAVLCSCNTGIACNAAAASSEFRCGCEGTLVSDVVYTVDMTGNGDCSTSPSNIVCNIEYVP